MGLEVLLAGFLEPPIFGGGGAHGGGGGGGGGADMVSVSNSVIEKERKRQLL